MNILGVNYYQHNSAAALISDGQLIAAAEEERFSRIKHDGRVPKHAVEYCLREGNLKLKDIDLIAVSVDFVRLFREKYLRYTLENFPKANELLMQNAQNMRTLLTAEDALRTTLNFDGRVEFFKHHLCHMASSFFMSGFEKATLVSMDGLGEIETTVAAYGDNKGISTIASQEFPHSLGLLYQAISAFLGYRFGSEGTVMALASFGNGDEIVSQGKSYNEIFDEMIILKDDGLFDINPDYFNFPYTKTGWVSNKFTEIFSTHKSFEAPITQHHKNIAAGLQNVFEKSYLHVIRHAIQNTGCKNLCLAGGCALNCVANGKIRESTDARELYIQPAANDAGTSIGAGFYAASIYDKTMSRCDRMNTTYWGPSYEDELIHNLLYKHGFRFNPIDDPAYEAAKLLDENKVIGWFQGRMEFGPRALGNRSILAPPNSLAVKDHINHNIKHREAFRPFAPSILQEHVHEYFKTSSDSPFMLEACHIRSDRKKDILGIIHIDDTSRIHVVTPERNQRYYDLIHHYYRLSGIPIVLNTSFNDKGEPIVCSPKDALADFIKLPLDALIIGGFLLLKENNLTNTSCHQTTDEAAV